MKSILATLLTSLLLVTCQNQEQIHRAPNALNQKAGGLYIYDWDGNLYRGGATPDGFLPGIAQSLSQPEHFNAPLMEDFRYHLKHHPQRVFINTARDDSPSQIYQGLLLLKQHSIIPDVPPLQNIWAIRHEHFPDKLRQQFAYKEPIELRQVRQNKLLVIQQIAQHYQDHADWLQFSDDNKKNIAFILRQSQENQLIHTSTLVLVNSNNPQQITAHHLHTDLWSTHHYPKLPTPMIPRVDCPGLISNLNQ